MNEGLISKRYARALLEYASARGDDKQVYERMKLLSQTLHATPQLREALQNPVLPLEDKLRLIYTASGEGPVSDSTRRFMRLVIRNDRGRLLQSIVLSYLDLYRQVNHITVVWITTAVPLSSHVAARIRRDVEMRTRAEVEMEIRVDPGIRGGMIFQIDDLRLDASVAGQLENVRRQFIQKNRIIV